MTYQQGPYGNYPSQPGYPLQPGYPVIPPPRKTNGLAVASLVLGLTGFITCGFTSLLAVIFGHVAVRQIRRDHTDGRGMAIGGLVLGWILTSLWIVYWALVFAGVIAGVAGLGTQSADRSAGRSGSTIGQRAVGDHEVTFEAEGVGGASSAGNVTYNVGFDIEQEAGVPLPYSKTVQAPEDTSTVSFWVQNADSAGVVKCRIKVDGETVREAKSNGPYGVCRVETGSLDQ